MFLSQEEIKELTGYKVYKCQIRWLNQNGIKYLVGYDGKPRVLLSHLEQVMGSRKGSEKKTFPDKQALLASMGLR